MAFRTDFCKFSAAGLTISKEIFLVELKTVEME